MGGAACHECPPILPPPCVGQLSAGVLDTHVHSILDYSKINYSYPADNLLHANWTYEDYTKATSASLLEPCEFIFMSLKSVPYDQYLAQSVLAQEQANAIEARGLCPRMVGIVSAADLHRPDAATFLDELRAKVPLARGVRAYYQPSGGSGPFPPSFVEGMREAARRGLSVEVLLAYQQQLGELLDAVSQVPEVTFIVNHLGHMGVPHAPTPDFAWWSATMEKLAALPNVHVKISGATALLPQDPLQLYLPFVKFVVEKFGYGRCLFAGNFPVVTGQEGFWGYRGWAAAVDFFLKTLNATETQRQLLLYHTGRRVYRVAVGSELHI